ncbi:MAG: acyltransferase family protein [Deltaproteobacteria bacterium]|nr:acyltransferase family protein [Deltaproteobacteria bacterium]
MNNRIFWADLMRALAIVGVLLIHCSAYLTYGWHQIPMSWWWISNLYNASGRIGVPLFIMLSGAMLLTKTEGYEVFFKKRVIGKLLIPLIAWSLIYFLWRTSVDHVPIKAAIKLILAGNISYHLVFFNYFLGIYLFMPLLRIIVNSGRSIDTYYYLLLWFICCIISLIHQLTVIRFGLFLPEAAGFVGYLILGHLLKDFDLKFRRMPYVIMLYIISMSITAYGVYRLSSQSGALNELFYTYLSPNIVIASCCGFLIIKKIGESLLLLSNFYLKEIIELLSKLSFGIFFIHVIWLETFRHFVNIDSFNPFIAVPLTVLLMLFVSIISILILRKIPYIKVIIP